MTAIVLQWRQNDPPVVTRWRGVDSAMRAAVARDPVTALAAVIGPPGSAGPAGPAGSTGLPGAAGATGLTGPAGPAGSPGSAGATGAPGVAGAAGPQGAIGPQGPAGPAGSAGVPGAAGATGPAGATGAQGPTGVAGPQGAAGVQGPAGVAGPQGPAGATGATGSQGPAGASGATATLVEVDLGSAAQRSGKFSMTGLSGLTSGSAVRFVQATGPYTNKGTLADEFEMDGVSAAGTVTSATDILAYWQSNGLVRGNVKFFYDIAAPTLGVLSLSQSSFSVGTPGSGTIIGATSGSTITAAGLPAGLTVNGAARTWTYDGVGAATTATVTLTETLASATNSPRASTVAVTIAAASGPANNLFAMFGDSRTQQGHPGIPADPNLGGYSAIGIQGALLSKVGGLISFDPENSMYGRSGAACIDSAAVPRGSTAGSATPSTAASAAVGADVCAASAAQSVIFLLGTNEAGSVNLAIGGTSWNAVISILNRFNGKYRVYILNEFPRGKTSAGALNNDLALADAGRHYQYSRDLMKLDKSSGDALSRPNCVVINSYDALLDVASGANRYNIVGMLSDGLHLTPLGADTVAQLLVASITATYPAAQRDPTKTNLITVNDNSCLGMNPLATTGAGQGNLSANFLTVNGAAEGTGLGKAYIPDYWRVTGSNLSDVNAIIGLTTDDQGYPCLAVQWSRASGGVAGQIRIDTYFEQVYATLQAKFNFGDKLRWQARVRLDNPVNCFNMSAQGTLRTTGGTDIGSISILGSAAIALPALPWMTFEGRNGDSTGLGASDAEINPGSHQCGVSIDLGAGATSGKFYVSRQCVRRYP